MSDGYGRGVQRGCVMDEDDDDDDWALFESQVLLAAATTRSSNSTRPHFSSDRSRKATQEDEMDVQELDDVYLDADMSDVTDHEFHECLPMDGDDDVSVTLHSVLLDS